jgi:transposase-like protein
MNSKTPSYQRHRFPSEIISHAVWIYHRFCLSFREVEALLAERGITVTYETVRQWSYGQTTHAAFLSFSYSQKTQHQLMKYREAHPPKFQKQI